MIAPALLLLAALVHLSPELLAVAGGSVKAWEYVAAGFEAFVLWCVAGLTIRHLAVRAVCAWGAFESLSRAGCRLAFPMEKAPRLADGQTLCSVATGMDTQWIGVVAALFVAALLRESGNEGR